MGKFLVLVVVLTIISAATSVKEWKNFENGKVYSHKMPLEKKEIQTHGAHRGPVVEERLLHSHHRDKKMKTNSLQATDQKPPRSKNPERHHKKSIEEEMHLRPLNERHHKFPNPALLDKIEGANPPSPQISKQNLLKQAKHGKINNRRRQRGGRRYKRNRSDQKTLALVDTISTRSPKKSFITERTTKAPNNVSDSKNLKIQETQKTQFTRDGFPLKISSYW